MRQQKKALPPTPRYDAIQIFDQLGSHVNRRETKDLAALSAEATRWLRVSYVNKVYYEWSWLGIPII